MVMSVGACGFVDVGGVVVGGGGGGRAVVSSGGGGGGGSVGCAVAGRASVNATGAIAPATNASIRNARHRMKLK